MQYIREKLRCKQDIIAAGDFPGSAAVRPGCDLCMNSGAPDLFRPGALWYNTGIGFKKHDNREKTGGHARCAGSWERSASKEFQKESRIIGFQRML